MDKLDGWVPVDTYSSVRVDEYNGKYSLQQGQRGDNDTYTSWCTPQKWSNSEKAPLKKHGEFVFVPWAISLGKDKEKALKTLQNLYNQLKNL